jgi:hypothetical protein
MDEIAQVLKASPEGATVWLGVRGRSMAPLLRSGDKLKVYRCGPNQLERGDIAILLREDGTLVAHLVTQPAPLKTSTYWGEADVLPAQAIGRAIAVRRGLTLWRIGAITRRSIWLGHRALQNQKVHQAVDAVRTGLMAPQTAWLRARVLSPTVRLLRNDEVSHLVTFLGDRGRTPPVATLLKWCSEGAVAGAFDKYSRLCAVAVWDAGKVAFIEARVWARGLELESRLVAELEAQAARREPIPDGH